MPTMFREVLRSLRFFFFQVAITMTLDLAFGALVYFILKGFTPYWYETPKSGQDESFAVIIMGNAMEAISTVLVIRLFQRYEHHVSRKWLRYVILGIGIFVTAQLTTGFVYRFDTMWTDPLGGNALRWIFGVGIVFAGIVTYLFFNYDLSRSRKIMEQEFQLLQLERLKTQAELDALQAKINPHFLYNALNSLATLIEHEPEKAINMVMLLSRFFRYNTSSPNDHFNTIGQEIEIARTYLDIEQVRFGDRLNYRITIQDDTLLSALIPRFLLQPIIENAVKHGISKISGKGIIMLTIGKEENWIVLSIYDNGPAFPDTIGFGYGLQSIYDKLRLLYQGKAELSIINQGIKQVVVRIPGQDASLTKGRQLKEDPYEHPIQNHFSGR